LLILQTLWLALGYFPLRLLLIRNTTLDSRSASMLAAGGILLPCFFSYASFLTAEAVYIPLLIYAVYFLSHLFDEPDDLPRGVGAGIFIGLALLTNSSAWVLWLSAFITLIPGLLGRSGSLKQLQSTLAALGLPILFVLIWALYVFLTQG